MFPILIKRRSWGERLQFMIVFATALWMPLAVFGQVPVYTKPAVRTITGFVRLDHRTYVNEITQALSVLRDAKRQFEADGYVVQSVRLVTQPLGQLIDGQSDEKALQYLRDLDALSKQEHFGLNVGPAMLTDTDSTRAIHFLAKALSALPDIAASAIMADDGGIHWKVIDESAALLRYITDHDATGTSSFNFAPTAMLKPYAPFFPGAYHDGAGRQFSIGFQSANVVQEVFARKRGDVAGATKELTNQLELHAKVAEAIGERVARASRWQLAGVDATPAPFRTVSIAQAFENFSGSTFGSSGTMSAALMITTAVKAVTVKPVGYSGLMLPVMEDAVLAKLWGQGTFTADSLLAYSAVCGTGLDTIPMPGDSTKELLMRIYGDVASLAWKWHKPLSARLLPMRGKRPGEMTEFQSKWLVNTTVGTFH